MRVPAIPILMRKVATGGSDLAFPWMSIVRDLDIFANRESLRQI